MIQNRGTVAAVVATILAGAAGSQGAWADSGGAEAVASTDALPEITVVAQKQNIDLQHAPEALTAITADQLAQANIVVPMDLNGAVPGLVITESEGFNRSVSIRGIGFNVPQDDSAQTSVSYHQDGIYIEYPAALNSGFLDVDHIEVLRGPQGTVFGQNAVGGTINVISRQPSFDGIDGYIDAEGGSRDLIHTSGALNLPIGDTLAIRASFDQDYQHGFTTATQVPGYGGGYDLGNTNSAHGRLLVLWKPVEDLSITLQAEYAQAKQHETENKNIDDPDSDPWQQSSDWPGRLDYNQQLAGVTIAYTLPFATLKAISSYQEVNQKGSVNEDGESLDITNDQDIAHDVEWFQHDSKGITEEMDLSSRPGGPVDWVVGAFYLKSKLSVYYSQYNLYPGDPAYDGTAAPNLTHANPDFSDPESALVQFLNSENSFGYPVLGNQLYFQNAGIENRDSASGFGQAIWHVTDQLRLTAGGRFTHDHNTTWFSDYWNQFNSFNGYQPIFVEQTNQKWTWRVATDYDLTETNMVYGSISTGFKPGGGNISDSPAMVPLQFQPETITAYEIGSKNSFLDKHLHLNLSAYLYKDKNMQFQAEDLIPFQGGVDNIPSVEVHGLEAELAALLPAGFRFDSNIGWEKGRITSHVMALDNAVGNAANNEYYAYCDTNPADPSCGSEYYVGSIPQAPVLTTLRQAAYRDVYGNSPPSLPEWTITTTLSHATGFADGSSLLLRLEGQYRSDYADTVFGISDPLYRAPSYFMTNVFADYTVRNTGLDFSLGVNNLFNRVEVLSRFTNQFGGETTQQYFAPLSIVAGVHYSFK